MNEAALIGTVILLLIVGTGLALVALSAWMKRKVEGAVPAQGRFIDVDGHSIHYVDSDPESVERPALILIHGLGAQLQHMTHSLSGHLEDEFRVIAIDRPGAGYSRRAKGGDGSLTGYARVVAGFIDVLGLDRPVLVGHSLGGAVALATALDHPSVTRGIVLVAPATQSSDEAPDIFRALVLRRDWQRHLVGWTAATPMGLRYGAQTARIAFHPDDVPDDFALRGGGVLGLRPGNFRSASMDLTSVPDVLPGLMERYGEIEVPVAIIHGTADTVVPFEANAVRQGKRLGAHVKALEGRGHMIPITAAPDVADFVREHARQWFASTAEPPSRETEDA